VDNQKLNRFTNELKNRDIQVSELKLIWYGIKEFYLKDNNGYILGFALQIRQDGEKKVVYSKISLPLRQLMNRI
jgi:hemolysin activation/secretion protein